VSTKSTPAWKEILDSQRAHWDTNFSQKPEMFGGEPSAPALKAAELFKQECKTNLLELGGGQGRDTLFFAREGFQVTVVDYSQAGLEALSVKAETAGLRESITPLRHDVREPLPFENNCFDCCYSHMLFCMALTTPQLEHLSDEVRRVLSPEACTCTRCATPGTRITEQESTEEKICTRSAASLCTSSAPRKSASLPGDAKSSALTNSGRAACHESSSA
jgi:SAM-dependent methyltransferase